MKKVVFFCPTKVWGGVEKNVRLRAEYFGEKGHKVWVVFLKGFFIERFEGLKNVEVVEISTRGGDLNMLVVFRYVRILNKIKPNAVFAALKKDWWLVSLSAYFAKIPNTVLYLGIKRLIRNSLKYRVVFNVLKPKVLVNSDSLKQHLLATSNFFNNNNLFRIYNGFVLPSPKAPSMDIKAALNLGEDTLIVGCAGRISPIKGYDLLPKILKKLPGHIHFVHAGEGNDTIYEDKLKQTIAASRVSHRIHFLGYLTNTGPFYKGIDMFLLSSRAEGMANVLNEALSYGKPVVSTRVEGTEELLEKGTYGIITEIDDVDALALAVRNIDSGSVVFNPKELQQHIAENFGLEQMMINTEKLLFSDDQNQGSIC